jgi:hypothetical protein
MAVFVSNPKERIAALGRALIPMLKELKATDGRMIEFCFVVSMSGNKMVLHKSTCGLAVKPVTMRKQ